MTGPSTATGPETAVPACPTCVGELTADDEALVCIHCRRRFPVVAGIPDLRIAYHDPYLSRDEDLAAALELESRFGELDFGGLLREHWRRTGKPVELAERFVAGDLAAAQRSERYLAEIEHERGVALGPSDRLLEIGCGTAGMAAAAASRAGQVVASDISMRWLVLAKKRLLEEGIDGVELVCSAGEEPPFAPASFDLVVAGDVIEHVARQADFIAACHRLLKPGGMLFMATPNRFSLGLEPHVRVWGVGFLPRRLARRYVLAVRKSPYEHVRLLSGPALRRLLTEHGFEVKILSPEIPAATQRMYSGIEVLLVRAYNSLRRAALVQPFLLAAGPFFHVFAKKGAG